MSPCGLGMMKRAIAREEQDRAKAMDEQKRMTDAPKKPGKESSASACCIWILRHGQCDSARDVTFVSLAFAVTRRDVIERVGLVANEYFFGQEEWDYSLRVRKSGYRLRYEPSIGCIHGGDGSHNNSSPEFVYNGYRNKLIFQQRYLPRWAFPVWRMAFGLYARTILPPTCVWIRGTKLPIRLLRFCALEALRDHTPGRRIEEADLLDFRQRVKSSERG